MTIYGRRYDTGEPVGLELANGCVASVERVASAESKDWPYLSPAFIDIQVNGHGGQEFSSADLSADRVATIARAQQAFGVAAFCPTVTTNRGEVMESALRAIDEACRRWPDVARMVPGIHLEGPYICADDGPRGAHPADCCRRPDWNEFLRFQEAAGGRIRVLTMSVDFYESPEFVRRAAAAGVVVSIGHTAADPAHIRWAVDAGARLSTHLGNGCHTQLHRHRNYIWEQLADDRLMASLIVDGFHLPAAVVKAFVRVKTPERIVLVSDASGLAGLPPGRYASNLCDVEILPNGKLVVAGQNELLAGASLPIGAGVANVMEFAGVDLGTAVRMATVNPGRLVNAPCGGLDVGDRADLIRFRLAPGRAGGPPSLNIESTWLGGEMVYAVV